MRLLAQAHPTREAGARPPLQLLRCRGCRGMQGSTAAAGLGDGEGVEAVLAGEGTTTGWRGRRIRAEAVLDGRGDARGRGILVQRERRFREGETGRRKRGAARLAWLPGPASGATGMDRERRNPAGSWARTAAAASGTERELGTGASLGRTTRREHREARRRDELRRRRPWLQRVAPASW